MKNNLMKIPTLLMLVVSIFMAVPANVFAIKSDTTGTATGQTAKVKVNGVETDNDSVTVNAYRIIDVNIDDDKEQPQSPVYTWAVEVGEWIKANYPEYIEQVKDADGNDVDNVIVDEDGTKHYAVSSTFSSTNSALDAAAFYDELAEAIRSYNSEEETSATNINVPVADSKEAADGNIELELTMGNYLLLIEGGMNVYRPSAINIVPEYNEDSDAWEVNDTTIEVKSSTPDIVKKVDSNKVSQNQIGGSVGYEVTVDIPTYPSNAIAKNIIISDKFTEGLTLDESSIVVTLNDGTKLTAGTDYTLSTTPGTGEDYTFQITFSNDNYDAVLKGKSQIIVTYNGIINGNAVVTDGNDNTVTLKYNNNPYDKDSFETKTDDVTVYTYGLKINKIDEKTKQPLSGAKFSITDANGKKLKFVQVTENGTALDGVYRLAIEEDVLGEDGTTVVISKDTNTLEEVEVSANGVLELRGLAQGTYYATETEAPAGYVKLQNPVKLTITDNETASELNGVVNEGDGSDGNDGLVEQDIENSDSIITLPVTGGMGTLLFSVVGIVFMGLATYLIKNVFKKEN